MINRHENKIFSIFFRNIKEGNQSKYDQNENQFDLNVMNEINFNEKFEKKNFAAFVDKLIKIVNQMVNEF